MVWLLQVYLKPIETTKKMGLKSFLRNQLDWFLIRDYSYNSMNSYISYIEEKE